MPHERPVRIVPAAHTRLSAARTRRGPKRSAAHPPAICIAAYGYANAEKRMPSWIGVRPRSRRISGPATEMFTRSTYATKYIRHRTKRTTCLAAGGHRREPVVRSRILDDLLWTRRRGTALVCGSRRSTWNGTASPARRCSDCRATSPAACRRSSPAARRSSPQRRARCRGGRAPRPRVLRHQHDQPDDRGLRADRRSVIDRSGGPGRSGGSQRTQRISVLPTNPPGPRDPPGLVAARSSARASSSSPRRRSRSRSDTRSRARRRTASGCAPPGR